jgi:UDP-3-O-[3-hydroxymyristoyl] glucosamine N-acyltransferase
MRTREIAEFVGGTLSGDAEVEIDRVSGLGCASPSSLVFLQSDITADEATPAGCALVRPGMRHPCCASTIEVSDPKLSFAKVAGILHPRFRNPAGIHPSATVSPSAEVSAGAFIGAHASVGDGASVGADTHLMEGVRVGRDVHVGNGCFIDRNVTLGDGTVIGDRAVIHAGAVLGADGFGFVRDGDAGYVKFPQLGRVIVGDDVEIGANTCIDRGALGDTVVGDGTKIDNLVQIAHNVKIGKRVVIASQTGISGSCNIEDDCVLAGQVGLGEGVTLRKGTVLGGQAGVFSGKTVRSGIWTGTPARPIDDQLAQYAETARLGSLRRKVENLQKMLEDLISRG